MIPLLGGVARSAGVVSPMLRTLRMLIRQNQRTMLSDVTNKLITRRGEGLPLFRDSYIFEFLDLPEKHKEKDLRNVDGVMTMLNNHFALSIYMR